MSLHIDFFLEGIPKEVDCKSIAITASNAEMSNVHIEEVQTFPMEVEENLDVPNEIQIGNERQDLCQDDHLPHPTDVPGEEEIKESIDVSDNKVELLKEDFADGGNGKGRKRRRRGGKVRKGRRGNH